MICALTLHTRHYHSTCQLVLRLWALLYCRCEFWPVLSLQLEVAKSDAKCCINPRSTRSRGWMIHFTGFIYSIYWSSWTTWF